MGRPRKYSDDQRAEAVEIYRTEGQAEASRRTDIPGPVINRWAKELGIVSVHRERTAAAVEVAKVVSELQRLELAQKYWLVANTLLDRALGHKATSVRVRPIPTADLHVVSEADPVEEVEVVKDELPSSTDARNFVIGSAVATDKMQLLTGSATARTESTTTTKVTDAIRNDAEWDALERAIQRELALQAAEGQGNAPADGGAVVAAPDTRDGEVR